MMVTLVFNELSELINKILWFVDDFSGIGSRLIRLNSLNPLMPGGNKKVTHA